MTPYRRSARLLAAVTFVALLGIWLGPKLRSGEGSGVTAARLVGSNPPLYYAGTQVMTDRSPVWVPS